MATANFLVRRSLARAKHSLRRAVVGRIPAPWLEPVAKTAWTLHSLFSSEVNATGKIRAEIGRDVLGLPESQAQRAISGAKLENFIDQRLYFGRQLKRQEVWSDLDAIARELAQRVEALKREAPGQPVFLSPFHYVSQYANIVVVERVGQLLGLESMSVVSGVIQNQYGDDHALIPGIRVLYTYGEAHRNNLGVRVARALKRDGVAVLFADVPPFTMHRYPMQTARVTMFGKDARIHNGIFRLGETFRAHMVPFYLRFSGGKFSLRTFAPLDLSASTAPQTLADYIETALLENYEQWLPAGYPAMYAFAPAH